MTARVQLPGELLARALAMPSPMPELEVERELEPAGVLVIVRDEPALSTLIVERSADLAEHAGELGFPGGKVEPGDADLRSTACREAWEEVGLEPGRARLLGALAPIPVFVGRHRLFPEVALVPASYPLASRSGELTRLFWLSLSDLLNERQPVYGFRVPFRGEQLTVPHFEVADRVLFGASACVLYDLLARLASACGLPPPPMQLVDVPPWPTE